MNIGLIKLLVCSKHIEYLIRPNYLHNYSINYKKSSLEYAINVGFYYSNIFSVFSKLTNKQTLHFSEEILPIFLENNFACFNTPKCQVYSKYVTNLFLSSTSDRHFLPKVNIIGFNSQIHWNLYLKSVSISICMKNRVFICVCSTQAIACDWQGSEFNSQSYYDIFSADSMLIQ